MTIAVIFVPTINVELYVTQCLIHCSALGHTVAGVVRSNWAAAFGMLISGAADVLVVARPEHLQSIDPHAVPRIEIAIAPPPATGRRNERRSHIIRPVGEGSRGLPAAGRR